MIDVSQSVEHDHPHALEFLRKDCNNVNGMFSFIMNIQDIHWQKISTQLFKALALRL